MGEYSAKVYQKQGGDELVVAAGGKITIEDGGVLELAGTELEASADEMNLLSGAGDAIASGTQVANIANAKVDYTTGDLDTEAEIIAAVNATNGKINDILAALLAFGIMAPTE